jgi:hypothetical protein
MLCATRVYSPSHHRLRFAIDRFLAGKITPMQLQSWCFAHFEPGDASADGREGQFWDSTMLNLSVFHHCDFHRSALEQSLAVLLASIDSTGVPTATPLTTSECCYEMRRSDRRDGDTRGQQRAIALGSTPCH